MSKGELIIAFLRSERSLAEPFNINLNDNKLSGSKTMLNRLRDILPREYRRGIKKKRYQTENKENLSEQENKKIDEYLTKLVRTLNKKEEYRHHGRDDPDYYGIRDMESLFSDIDDYCEPILVKSSFK